MNPKKTSQGESTLAKGLLAPRRVTPYHVTQELWAQSLNADCEAF